MTPYLMETYSRDVFGPRPAEELAATLHEMTFVEMSEAARMLYEEDSQEVFLYHEFLSLLPPWPVTWFEFNIPRYSRSGQVRIDLHPQAIPRAAGLAMTNAWGAERGAAMLRDDGLLAMVERRVGRRIPQAPQAETVRRAAIAKAVKSGASCRSTVLFQGYFEAGERLHPGAVAGFYLDERGRSIEGTHFVMNHTNDRRFAESESKLLIPVLYGVSLLAMDNVTTEPITVGEEERRARLEKGLPDIEYRTLVV